MIVKIVSTTNLTDLHLRILGGVCQVEAFDSNIPGRSTAEVIARAQGADVIGVNAFTPVTAHVIESLPQLRSIVSCSAGIDHVDLDACERAGVNVHWFPGYCARTLAEKTLMYVLMGLNRVVAAIDTTRAGSWNYLSFQGRETPGRTIAILGHGATGRILHGFCEALGFTVETTNSTTPAEEVQHILASADIITLHMSLNAHTQHFLNEATLGLLRDEVVIVNTARGGLVDDVALASFLSRSPGATAFLDVLNTEPPGYVHPYRGLPNAVITPHIGWNSAESNEDLAIQMLTMFVDLAIGKVPLGSRTEIRGIKGGRKK